MKLHELDNRANPSNNILQYDHTGDISSSIIYAISDHYTNNDLIDIQTGHSNQSISAYANAVFLSDDGMDIIDAFKVRYSDHVDRYGSDISFDIMPYVTAIYDDGDYIHCTISKENMDTLIAAGIKSIDDAFAIAWSEWESDVVESSSYGPIAATSTGANTITDNLNLDVGPLEQEAIKKSRHAPTKQISKNVNALSTKDKPAMLTVEHVLETIRRPIMGTLNNEYQIVDESNKTVGEAVVRDGVIEKLEFDTEASQDYSGNILSAMLSQIVGEADRRMANLSVQLIDMDGSIKYLFERFGFRLVRGDIMKRNAGSIRPTSVQTTSGLAYPSI